MDLLFCEGAVEEPCDYGEVAPFVVGGDYDGVFLFLGGSRGGHD